MKGKGKERKQEEKENQRELRRNTEKIFQNASIRKWGKKNEKRWTQRRNAKYLISKRW